MGCILSQNYPQVDINFGEPFGDVKPGSSEQDVHRQVTDVIEGSGEVFVLIEEYKGCQELARAAMSNPSPETELAAFEGLLGAVSSIARFYQFSTALEKVFPVLLEKLADEIPGGSDVAPLDETPALTGQLAAIFNFALDFDRIRMLRPNLSNDFSYYRRLLPKFNKHPDITVKDDEASAMALFTAQHIPMTQTLSKAANKAKDKLANQMQDSKISIVLATMANSCLMILSQKDITISKGDEIKIARTMTGAVVIFDHVDPQGAFHRRTPLAIKNIVNTLKNLPNRDTGSSLLNAVRYSSRSFRDAPDNIQALFD